MKRWDFPGGNFFSMSCGETPSYVFFLTLWFLSFYYNRALTLLNIWLMKIGLLHGWTVQYFIFCIRCCREPSNSAEIEIMQHSDKVRKVMWSSQERKEEYKKEAIGKCVCVLQLLDIAAALQFWNASAAEALKHQIEWDKFVLRINLQFIYICISMWSADKKKTNPGNLHGIIVMGEQKVPNAGSSTWDGWVSFCYPSPSLESKKCLA